MTPRSEFFHGLQVLRSKPLTDGHRKHAKLTLSRNHIRGLDSAKKMLSFVSNFRKLHDGIINLYLLFKISTLELFFCIFHHISSIWTKVLNLYLILKKFKKTSSFAALNSRSGWDTKLGWFCSQGNVPDATSSCEMSLDVDNVLIEIRLTRNYVIITW